ncbi:MULTISPECIES: hypothetical protein [Lacticaseibacillus]|uniref:Ubiquitin-like domain-containing protein n=3 Tax=Lacticaseibacillus TaxID=2759736 RepID=A0AAN1EZY1_LACCA|nr:MULTISPECIES: hypothetical protein [Lacticaseibacillus]ARY92251.1 hypothetical protein BGL52_10995 [Lacticaseibacillus casei]KAB1971301.1 hypothetical protein F9B82_02105 [Lacticaseibacillus casei]TLF41860.1 hypothetical protein FEI15_01225 [Lacticaseibacillus zeae]WLV80159.1 hypothetical protein LACSTY_002210 [Lacticaseibacillus sp. NCIMB 15473]WNX24118.1 hypothetical protein RWA15_10770 [Lacticaseibacillus casei]
MADKNEYVNVALEVVSDGDVKQERDLRVPKWITTRQLREQITEDLELDRNQLAIDILRLKYKDEILTDSQLMSNFSLAEGDVIDIILVAKGASKPITTEEE